MSFTIIGAGGFIGGHLVARLRNAGEECNGGGRDFLPQPGQDYGDVIYAAGLTADFRQRPMETVDAHVCSLKRWLEQGKLRSLTYLSSTRVYQHGSTTEEDSALLVNPGLSGDLYNLSKLMGESLCLSLAVPHCRIVRLSNVIDPQFAPTSFLGSVVREAAENGVVRFQTAPESAKDFIALEDVVDMLPKVAVHGSQRLYNLASGVNTTNLQIAGLLRSELGCRADFAPGAPRHTFPPINIARLRSEFGFMPRDPVQTLRRAAADFHRRRSSTTSSP